VAVATPELGDERAAELLRVARRSGSPGLVVTAGAPDASGIPLLVHRPLMGDKATAYLCRGSVCDAPATEPAELTAALATEY
jgi:uncharacterized protein YyaL (SSP411 family)